MWDSIIICNNNNCIEACVCVCFSDKRKSVCTSFFCCVVYELPVLDGI